MDNAKPPASWRLILVIGIVSFLSLFYESLLIRILGISQHYHFAFLIISLALLGFGASGSFMLVFPLNRVRIEQGVMLISLCFILCVGIAYVAVNSIPFDAYMIAWELRQYLYLVVLLICLTLPLFCAGLLLIFVFRKLPESVSILYAANLVGSGIGTLCAPWVTGMLGVFGSVLSCIGFGLLVVLPITSTIKSGKNRIVTKSVIGFIILLVFSGVVLNAKRNLTHKLALEVTVSPYKAISTVLNYPGARVVWGRWTDLERVDIVESDGIRSLAGMSYVSSLVPPAQFGLLTNGNNVQPIIADINDFIPVAPFLMESLVYRLVPDANVLILKPGGGLAVVQALLGDASEITAVFENPYIPQAIDDILEDNFLEMRNVNQVIANPRVFLSQSKTNYDIVVIPLSESYHPVTNGSFSLVEEYLYTLESFQSLYAHLQPSGILVVTRWLQVPPSESLKMLALLMDSYNNQIGVPFEDALVAYRGMQTMTILVKPAGWSRNELDLIRKFASELHFDFVWLPDVKANEVNQWSKFPQPYYYDAVRGLLGAEDRNAYYQNYPYRISPPRDKQPFFFHFYKWTQIPSIFVTAGKLWQPFGGSGYLLLFLLLFSVLFICGLLMLPPIVVQRFNTGGQNLRSQVSTLWLIYFGLIGAGYITLEVPLIQQFILPLEHSIYAFAICVFILLLGSGIGSVLIHTRVSNILVVCVIITLYAFSIACWGSKLADWLLQFRFLVRFGLIFLVITPLAILMGMAFPSGMNFVNKYSLGAAPWLWAINGFASVLFSIVSILIAIEIGYHAVFGMAAILYLLAGIVWMEMKKESFVAG